jgi:hypothetical protein
VGRRENLLWGYKGNIPNDLGRAWFVLAGLVPWLLSLYLLHLSASAPPNVHRRVGDVTVSVNGGP